MKLKWFALMALICGIFLQSCSVQKRKYLPGFYVTHKKCSHSPKENVVVKESLPEKSASDFPILASVSDAERFRSGDEEPPVYLAAASEFRKKTSRLPHLRAPSGSGARKPVTLQPRFRSADQANVQRRYFATEKAQDTFAMNVVAFCLVLILAGMLLFFFTFFGELILFTLLVMLIIFALTGFSLNGFIRSLRELFSEEEVDKTLTVAGLVLVSLALFMLIIGTMALVML